MKKKDLLAVDGWELIDGPNDGDDDEDGSY